jgi:hypothetical protein
MNFNHHSRGGLARFKASLVYVWPHEILKWQYPIYAAAEKFVQLRIWFGTILRFSSSEVTHH